MKLISRCSAGKNRWFWVCVEGFQDGRCWSVWPPERRDYVKCVVASGYETTSEQATRAAIEAAAGDEYHHWQPTQSITRLARWTHEELTQCKRSRRKATDGTAVEYVYSVFHSHDDSSLSWRRHPVTRRTKRSLFVNHDGCDWMEFTTWNGEYVASPEWKHTLGMCEKTCRIPLEKWGEDGYYHRRTFAWYYPESKFREALRQHLARREKRTTRTTFDLHDERLSTLGITTPHPSRSDIENAFRRAAALHHPDCGGCAREFDRIRKAYKSLVAAIH